MQRRGTASTNWSRAIRRMQRCIGRASTAACAGCARSACASASRPADIVKRVQPVLVAALPNATGQRAADLFAHLGWADYLLAREGATAGDPAAQFQRSIKEEPDNVYAHAMWAQHLWWFRDRDAEARQHRDSRRQQCEREFVRSLQFGGSLSRAKFVPYAVIVANDMRLAGEAMTDSLRNRLWSAAYQPYLFAIDDRSNFLAILPPDAHLATFDWLFPRSAMRSGDVPVWRYARAVLLANAGQTVQARAELEALLKELNADKVDRIVDQTRRMLAELSPKRSTSRR